MALFDAQHRKLIADSAAYSRQLAAQKSARKGTSRKSTTVLFNKDVDLTEGNVARYRNWCNGANFSAKDGALVSGAIALAIANGTLEPFSVDACKRLCASVGVEYRDAEVGQQNHYSGKGKRLTPGQLRSRGKRLIAEAEQRHDVDALKRNFAVLLLEYSGFEDPTKCSLSEYQAAMRDAQELAIAWEQRHYPECRQCRERETF